MVLNGDDFFDECLSFRVVHVEKLTSANDCIDELHAFDDHFVLVIEDPLFQWCFWRLRSLQFRETLLMSNLVDVVADSETIAVGWGIVFKYMVVQLSAEPYTKWL